VTLSNNKSKLLRIWSNFPFPASVCLAIASSTNFVYAEGFGGAMATTRKSIRVEQELRGRFYRDVQAKSSTRYRTRFPDPDRRNTVINQRLEPERVGDAPPKRFRLVSTRHWIHYESIPGNLPPIASRSGETAQD
jgi:hypothetical protein